MELLTTLLRTSAAASLRVLGAYRSTEVRPPDPLGMTLGEWAAAGLAALQRLGPLARQEAQDLFQLVLAEGKAPSTEQTEQALKRTGGVPFFLASCTEALRSGTQAGSEEAVPWNVAQSIRQRVAALSREAQEVLAVAAVIGRQMKRQVLFAAAPISDQDEDARLLSLEEVGRHIC